MNGYQKVDVGIPIDIKQSDPVHCCLEGSFLNCPENSTRFEKGACTAFMAQRCARNWDNVCDLYLEQQQSADFTSKRANEFLTEAFTFKYCRDDTSDPNNKCYTRCEKFNPNSANSAIICKTYGNNAYRDINTVSAISTDFFQDAKLKTTSPIKVHSCKKTCDVLSLSSFENDDRLLNEVLDRGIVIPGLMNLSENIINNSVPVNNKRLQQFISTYIVNREDLTQPNPLSVQLGSANVIANYKTNTPVPTNNNAFDNDNTFSSVGLNIAPAQRIETIPKARIVQPSLPQQIKGQEGYHGYGMGCGRGLMPMILLVLLVVVIYMCILRK